MILVDTSVWIAHLRAGSATLADVLDRGAVLGHPWVTGELALGSLRNRAEVLALLNGLPQAIRATTDEVLVLVERAGLHGKGIGYVDAQLLAATLLTPETLLWSDDRRLKVAAAELHVGFRSCARSAGRGGDRA